MWDLILPAYQEAIAKESDLDVLCELLNGVGQCVEELGEEVVSDEHMKTVFTIIHEQLKNFENRRAEREKKSKDEEADEDDQENPWMKIIEVETSVLARISDINHFSFQIFKNRLLPIFDKLEPQFTALLDPNRPFQDNQWGICIFDDVIEYCGEESYKYHEKFLNPMRNALSGKYPEVIQAAAYGFGIMGLKGGMSYAASCALALDHWPRLLLGPKPNPPKKTFRLPKMPLALSPKFWNTIVLHWRQCGYSGVPFMAARLQRHGRSAVRVRLLLRFGRGQSPDSSREFAENFRNYSLYIFPWNFLTKKPNR